MLWPLISSNPQQQQWGYFCGPGIYSSSSSVRTGPLTATVGLPRLAGGFGPRCGPAPAALDAGGGPRQQQLQSRLSLPFGSHLLRTVMGRRADQQVIAAAWRDGNSNSNDSDSDSGSGRGDDSGRLSSSRGGRGGRGGGRTLSRGGRGGTGRGGGGSGGGRRPSTCAASSSRAALDISNTAWALAKLEYGVGLEAPAEQQHSYASAVDAAMRPRAMAGAKPQHWSNLLYALARVRHRLPPELLDAGAAAAELRQGNSQACANTLWALAVLRLRHVGLEAAVCGRLGELLKSNPGRASTQHVANSLWALAVFEDRGAAAAALAVQLAHEAVGRPLDSFIPEQLCQLWQAQQELGGEVVAVLGSSPGLQAAMAAAVEAQRGGASSQEDQRANGTTPRQVAAALRRLQQQGRLRNLASVQEEVAVPGVLGPVDIVLRWVEEGQQAAAVAVEFDGPTHYLANRPHDPSAVDGPTALRNRQLARTFGEGRVLCVPYWESTDEQEAYLLQRLQPLCEGG
ncbi:hypothetical protein HYH02_014626 [Chlamydomonas schloesseri]|uniref:RAP domain-containing protein n=1 Tax=Chlamydomonas schloesseri TaxID=2026947 RepID=A0A835SWM1_9CHLO|nr:hypothetical protein HYH02_014626 [Chlamydomonas schloesseri]|eukprot:KAG2427221.1 hypothetical protein HYH02_014626 [Chlamydomonas schloesseri]